MTTPSADPFAVVDAVVDASAAAVPIGNNIIGCTIEDAYNFAHLQYKGGVYFSEFQSRMLEKFGSSIPVVAQDWIGDEIKMASCNFGTDGFAAKHTLNSVKMNLGRECIRVSTMVPEIAMRWFSSGLTRSEVLKACDADIQTCLKSVNCSLWHQVFARLRNLGNIFIPGDFVDFGDCATSPCPDPENSHFHMVCLDMGDGGVIPWCLTYRVSESTFPSPPPPPSSHSDGHLVLCDLSYMAYISPTFTAYKSSVDKFVDLATSGCRVEKFLRELKALPFGGGGGGGTLDDDPLDDLRKKLKMSGKSVYDRLMTPWLKPQRVQLRGLSSVGGKKKAPTTTTTNDHCSPSSHTPQKRKRLISPGTTTTVNGVNGVGVAPPDTAATIIARKSSELYDKLRKLVEDGGPESSFTEVDIEALLGRLDVEYYCPGKKNDGCNLYYCRGSLSMEDGRAPLKFDKVDTPRRLLTRLVKLMRS